MKLFVALCGVLLALGAEVSFFKDITDLCEESKGTMNCIDDTQCESGGSCIETSSSAIDHFRFQVGPVELLDEKVCQCTMGLFGPSCTHSDVILPDKCPDDNYCQNGGSTNWVFQPLSGCNCQGTNHFGWHCEHDNLELCAYVDYDGMTDWVENEMNVTDCGECLWHDDCSQSNAICIYDKTSDEPNNYCVVPCEEGSTSEHGVCAYDENAGQHVWTCDPGYKNDCTTLPPCEERCLNGGENNCADMEDVDGDCICDDPFEGAFCEKVDQCHPGLCDLETNDCHTENGEKECVAKASGASVALSVALFGLVSVIDF